MTDNNDDNQAKPTFTLKERYYAALLLRLCTGSYGTVTHAYCATEEDRNAMQAMYGAGDAIETRRQNLQSSIDRFNYYVQYDNEFAGAELDERQKKRTELIEKDKAEAAAEIATIQAKYDALAALHPLYADEIENYRREKKLNELSSQYKQACSKTEESLGRRQQLERDLVTVEKHVEETRVKKRKRLEEYNAAREEAGLAPLEDEPVAVAAPNPSVSFLVPHMQNSLVSEMMKSE